MQKQEPMQQLPEASAARFVCGLVAGMFAKLATHPLDVAKKRFQVPLLTSNFELQDLASIAVVPHLHM